MQSTNVVHNYSCPHEDCRLLQNINYIGLTTNILDHRLSQHVYSGAPKEHFPLYHGQKKLTRQILESNVTILEHFNDRNRLHIAEALLIAKHNPAINIQDAGFSRTLRLYS